MGAIPAFDQDSFIIRFDNGTELTATSVASKNVNCSFAVGTNLRPRFLIQLTGSNQTIGYQLQYNLNGAGWNNVTTSSSVVKAVNSSNVTDGTPTTQQIGSGVFIAGEISTDGVTAAIILLLNTETEVEYVIQIVGADVNNNDTIQLRCIRSSGQTFDTYTNTPTITVIKASRADLAGLLLTGVT